MPYTPEAQAKIAALYGWFRQRLVLLIVTAMLVLQFITWRSIERVATSMPSSPPDCDYRRPCHVQGIVSLDNDTIRRISR